MKNPKVTNMVNHQVNIKNENTKKLLRIIRKIEKKGEKISVVSVSDQSGVSRQTIYRNEAIMNEINLHRNRHAVSKSPSEYKTTSQAEIIKSLRKRIAELEEEKRLLVLQLVEKEETRISNRVTLLPVDFSHKNIPD